MIKGNPNQTSDVLLITKPLVPPWHDSGKNIPRDLVIYSRRYRYRIFVPSDGNTFDSKAIAEPIYRNAGHFSPPLMNQIRLLRRLLSPSLKPPIYHYFFTPNPRTSMIGRLVMGIKRQSMSVQTVTSEPSSYEHIRRLIFADRIVALSQTVQNRLETALEKPVELIYPAIPIPNLPSLPERQAARLKWRTTGQFTILYPGDYVYSKVTPILREATLEWIRQDETIQVFLACRAKTPSDRAEENQLKRCLSGVGERVRFLGEVDDMQSLLTAVDLVIFPVLSLYGKMDFPLVVLEAMALGIPVIVSDLPTLQEMVNGDPDMIIPAGEPGPLLQVVGELKGSASFYQTISSRVRQMVESRFDAQQMADHYESLYDQMLH